MDTKALRIFDAVAGAGSISRAAEDLNYVQSNVSGRILQLEDELGVALFHRKSRGVALTPAGRVLQDYAGRVLHLVDEARKAVQDSADCGGRLAIGTLETTAAVRLPPLLLRYRDAFPKVELMLSTGHTRKLVAEVLDYALDGAFVSGATDHDDIVQEAVFEEELVLVTGPDAKTSVGDQALLLFHRGCTYRIHTEQWLHEIGQAPARIMEFGSLDAIVGCAAAGLGLAVLPRAVVDRPEYRTRVRLHDLPGHLAHVTTYFIRHRETAPTRALAGLVDIARETVAP